MIDKHIAKQGLLHSGLAVLYVIVITQVMTYAGKLFAGDGKGWVGPVTFLLILVVSAAVMGSLVFGKPIMLYIDGKKREAVALAACTIGSLAAIAALIIVAAAALHLR